MSSVSRSVGRPVSRSVLAGQSNDLASIIKNLFANNEQGFAYDPNDLTTLYQDAAGTTPVTAVGQPVGLLLDKSGNNNHAFQTTSASRPILRKNAVTGANYLEFDGTDDFLQTANIDFTATDKVSLFAGVRKLSDAVNGVLLETSIAFTGGLGTFCLFAPRLTGTAGNFGFGSKGTIVAEATTPAILAPTSVVVSTQASISTNKINLRINGILSASSNNSQGAGNYGNHPLYIGRRGGTYLPFNGHLYSLIGIGKLTSDDETAVIEKELAKRVGVTLNV
jgi:hypothetical protein